MSCIEQREHCAGQPTLHLQPAYLAKLTTALAINNMCSGRGLKLHTVLLEYSCYLICACSSGRGKSSSYHKDDLWVIGSTRDLQERDGGNGSSSWVAVARSCWHGPNKEGR